MLAGMPAAIEIHDLHKSYGDLEAVAGVDLTVESGEIFALLGPNGAGKTTIVEIMEGHRKRTSGEVSVLGYDPGNLERAFKERIGIVLQDTGVERFLTVAEVVELYRGYYPHPRPLDEVIEVVGLSDKADVKAGKLSGGQQRRLDVAVGLAGDPDLLFLDEPTTGFDPSARRKAWDMVRNLKALGKTVFLTTHYMEEAQQLASRVAIIVGGKIVAEGPPQELADDTLGSSIINFALPPGAEMPHATLEGMVVDDGRATVRTNDPVRDLNRLTGWALDHDVSLEGLTVSQPALEDIYLSLTADAEPGAEV
jgi:ABC-2 type transport system ATP-binding protein